MQLRDTRVRAVLVALALLALLSGWLLVRAGDDTAHVVPQAQAAAAAALGTGPATAGTAAGAVPPTALAPPVSTTARGATPAATRPAARSRAGDPPPAPAPAVAGGTKLGGPSSLDDVIQDQGTGVPLPDGNELWIFADTTQLTHDPYFFVTSSGAVTTRTSPKLRYAANGKGVPIEFLPRTAAEKTGEVAGQRYQAVWPTGATVLPGGRVIVGYAKYDVTVATQSYVFLGAGLYEYHYPGLSGLAKAKPATRIAELWTPADGAVGSPLYADGYLYLTRCENLQCYSARAPVSSITDRASYRWRTGSGWSASRADRTSMSYGDSRPGRNPSTVRLPQHGVYGVVDTAAGAASTTALLWTGPNPWGPWSEPARFTLPKCPAAGCYTLNLHTAHAPRGAVRVSYATHGEGPWVRVSDVAVGVGGGAVSARVL